MSKVIRILSLAVLLAAFMGCRKTPVDNGEEPGQEPQEYERYVKGNRFKSQILGEHITYSLFMPADYEINTEASYPVIYFLHGFGESSTKDWTKYMNVIASLEESQGVQPMIYVFPNGYNSYYSNTYDGKFPYMDMFINELVPYIDANYRTVADREHRGIMGYSMGGFGAMVLAMKHPETFGMSAPMSMSFRTDEQYMAESQDGWNNQWGSIFGGYGQKGEGRITDYYKAHCPLYQFTSENLTELSKVKWFLHCGDDEEQLLIANDNLHVQLCENGYDHEFRIGDGAHSDSYWMNAEREIIPWMNHVMNGGGKWMKVADTGSIKMSELNEDGSFASKAYKEAETRSGLAIYLAHNGFSKDLTDKIISMLSQFGSIFPYMILPCDLDTKPLTEWMSEYTGKYGVGGDTKSSHVIAFGNAGRSVWDNKDKFSRFYLIDADLAEDESTIKADAEKSYYMDHTDESENYMDMNAMYRACKNVMLEDGSVTEADFEYRMRNASGSKDEDILLAAKSIADNLKYN